VKITNELGDNSEIVLKVSYFEATNSFPKKSRSFLVWKLSYTEEAAII